MELSQELQQIRNMAQTIIHKIDAVAGAMQPKPKAKISKAAQAAIEKRRTHIEKTILNQNNATHSRD